MMSRERLTTAEAAELAGQVAQLTRAGLPLETGLVALADELPRGRLAHALRALAGQLAAGVALDEAVDAQGSRVPEPLRSLIVASVRSGRPAEVLEEFVDLQQCGRQLRRRIAASLAYPTLLLGLTALLLVLLHVFLVHDMRDIFRGFGTELPALTYLFLDMFGPQMWGLVAVAILLLAVLLTGWLLPGVRIPGLGSPAGFLQRVPLIGPPLRMSRLTQFARLLGLLLEQQVPLPEALRLTASALYDADMTLACRRMADDVEAGWGLPESMAEERCFPASLVPLVQWGQQTGALPDAFRTAAEMFQRRSEARSTLLEIVIGPLTFLVVAAFVAFFVLALLLPLLASLRMISTDSDPDRKDILQSVLRLVGWVLIVVGCANCFVGLLGFFVLIWLILLGVVLLMAAGQRRNAEQYALLGLLAAAVERSMSLVDVIEAFSRECHWLMRRRTHRLAALLASGVSLGDALAAVPRALPAQSRPLIGAAAAVGALAPGLRQAAATGDNLDALWNLLMPKILYLWILPCYALGIVSFLMLKIVPQFSKIFADFGTTLPGLTQGVIDVSQWFERWWFIFQPAAFVLTLLCCYVAGRYMRLFHWNLPGTAWLVRRLDTATILDTLALVARQQRPLVLGLQNLAWFYPKRTIRRKLDRVLADVHAGSDWCDSLYRRGLIGQAERTVLQAAVRVNNLPWAMEEMAQSSRRRFSYRVQALTQMLFPPIIVAFGVAVMLVVVAFFIPLIALIQSLT